MVQCLLYLLAATFKGYFWFANRWKTNLALWSRWPFFEICVLGLCILPTLPGIFVYVCSLHQQEWLGQNHFAWNLLLLALLLSLATPDQQNKMLMFGWLVIALPVGLMALLNKSVKSFFLFGIQQANWVWIQQANLPIIHWR